MVTSSQLSEADAGERRRLVNAFLHGSAGALDLQPSREGRAVVAGLLLAGLLTGGCALVRVATSEPPDTRPFPPAGRTADESAGSGAVAIAEVSWARAAPTG